MKPLVDSCLGTLLIVFAGMVTWHYFPIAGIADVFHTFLLAGLAVVWGIRCIDEDK